jgi:60 kDa SS-A/Ro ribonucleoprotein
MVKLIADRLRNEQEIAKSRVFPYQLMMAYINYEGEHAIKEALQDAMEIAIQNVPALEGKIVIAVDVSGSMAQAVTGARGSATSKARCVDVAALFAACVLRKNPDAVIMPFNGDVVGIHMNSRDSIMTNAEKLARLCNNGTNCSAPLVMLNRENAKADAIIYFSDNESWMDQCFGRWYGFGPCGHAATGTMKQWSQFKVHCPKAKMICLDLVPSGTLQVKSDTDILNIGGLNDNVFMLISDFVKGKYGASYWTDQIEKIDLNKLDSDRN